MAWVGPPVTGHGGPERPGPGSGLPDESGLVIGIADCPSVYPALPIYLQKRRHRRVDGRRVEVEAALAVAARGPTAALIANSVMALPCLPVDLAWSAGSWRGQGSAVVRFEAPVQPPTPSTRAGSSGGRGDDLDGVVSAPGGIRHLLRRRGFPAAVASAVSGWRPRGFAAVGRGGAVSGRRSPSRSSPKHPTQSAVTGR